MQLFHVVFSSLQGYSNEYSKAEGRCSTSNLMHTSLITSSSVPLLRCSMLLLAQVSAVGLSRCSCADRLTTLLLCCPYLVLCNLVSAMRHSAVLSAASASAAAFSARASARRSRVVLSCRDNAAASLRITASRLEAARFQLELCMMLVEHAS
jgi:hypothetical protein